MQCIQVFAKSTLLAHTLFKYKHLLKHPAIEAFLLIKWNSIWLWYFLNWLIYLIFLITLTYMVFQDSKYSEACFVGLCSLLTLLVLREIVQFLTTKNKCSDYILQLGNFLEWTVIITSAIYVIGKKISNENQQWTINSGSLAILFGKFQC